MYFDSSTLFYSPCALARQAKFIVPKNNCPSGPFLILSQDFLSKVFGQYLYNKCLSKMFWTTRLFEQDIRTRLLGWNFLFKIVFMTFTGQDFFEEIFLTSMIRFLWHVFLDNWTFGCLDDILAHTLINDIFLGSLKLHKSVNVSNSTSYLCI